MIRVFNCFLLSTLVSTVMNGLYWLATANLLPVAASASLSLMLCSGFDLALRLRRIREQEWLNGLYRLPSHGR